MDAFATHHFDQYLADMERLVEIGIAGLTNGEVDDAARQIASDLSKKKKRDLMLLAVLAVTEIAQDRWAREGTS